MVYISFANNISCLNGGNGFKPFFSLISFNLANTRFREVVGAEFETLTPTPQTRWNWLFKNCELMKAPEIFAYISHPHQLLW